MENDCCKTRFAAQPIRRVSREEAEQASGLKIDGVALSQAAQIDRTLAALADPHRRGIVELLRDRPRRAGEIAEAIGLNPPALSRHLRTLKATDLIEESHPAFDARVCIYTLRPQPMAELRTWLEQTEQLWATQLAAFKAHLDEGGA